MSFFSICSAAFAVQTIIYSRPETLTDIRSSYPVALLKMCEEKNPQAFVLQPSPVLTQKSRSIRQLMKGDGMDVVWALTNEERERLLLPIRIPIDRGLLGWRLLLVRNTDIELFNSVHTKAQLAELVAVQGHDWPDGDVLRANHFTLSTGSTYPGLFHMLARGHIQYFPRSITEIWPERDERQALNIDVQKHLIIHYPAAFYFFVNKHNIVLANYIEACLNNAIKDGSFAALFDQYYRDAILKADIPHRTIIQLNNPLLPEQTPLANSAYWFTPTEVH